MNGLLSFDGIIKFVESYNSEDRRKINVKTISTREDLKIQSNISYNKTETVSNF